jgi:tRNA A-37 threonylcarbamoyl transferase component Bud32
MAEPVRSSWDLRTRAPIEAAWALLSDTDAFNRVAGVGFTFTAEKQADGTTGQVGHLHRLGMHLTWDERPFRFRAPERYSYQRLFHGGPASSLEGSLQLEPLPHGGTRIRYEVVVHPRSFVTRPIVALDAAMSTRPQLDATLRKAVRTLDEGVAFDVPPPLEPAAEALLVERTRALPVPIAQALRDYLKTASLADQGRIRPLAIARRAGVDEAAAALALLQAVRDGALMLRWQLLCPSCLGAKSILEQLPDRRTEVHCPTCDIAYDGTFPDSVEVVFRPVPAIRAGDPPVDCVLAPGRTPHVVAQLGIPGGSTVEERVLLAPGTYRIRLPGGGAASVVEVTDGPPAEAGPSEAMVDLSKRGVLPSVLRVAAGPVTLTLRSRLPADTLVVIDRRWRPPDALTAGRLLEFPGARELLPPEALAQGAVVETARGVVLAAESPRDPEVVRAKIAPSGGRLYSGNGAWLAVWDDAVSALAGAELLAFDARASGALAVGPVVTVGEDRIPSGPAVDLALTALRRGGGARFAVTAAAWADPEVRAAITTLGDRVAVVAPTPGGDVRVRFPAAEKARRQGVIAHRKGGEGRIAGLYRVLGTIAEGAFGRVLEAEDTAGKPVAIKVLKPEAADDPLAVQLFYNEARILSALRGAHVIRVFDYGETEDEAMYLAMERLHGRELAVALGEGTLPPAHAVAIALEVLEGLEEAHAAGVVHRDLKPENLFLARSGGRDDFVKVLDFGVASGAAGDPAEEKGVSLGTPLYMSPEQLENDPVDARSDLYAVGLLLYRMLAGTLPWDAPNPRGVVFKRLREPGRALSEVATQPIPPALEAAVMKAIARDPADRFPSAGAMRAALRRV